MSSQNQVLISAPLGFQLTPLAKMLGRFEVVDRNGAVGRKFSFLGRDVILFCSGVGRKQSAENLATAATAFDPGQILFINVACSLRYEQTFDDPFYISSASLWPGESANLSIDQAVQLQPTFGRQDMPLISTVKGGGRVRRGRLLTMDYLANTVREKRKLSIAGYDLVDAEFAAVAAGMATEYSQKLSGLMVASDVFHVGLELYKRDPDAQLHELAIPMKFKHSMKKATYKLGSFVHLWLRTLFKRHSQI
jgi:nucleoside phosphorylase